MRGFEDARFLAIFEQLRDRISELRIAPWCERVTFSSGRPVNWTGDLLQRRSSTISCAELAWLQRAVAYT
jgi:hypothetical protein